MEDSRRIWTRGGTTRSRERDRREVGTACLSERDRSSCFSKATHVTSSFQIQTRLSYLNSNIFPLLLRGSHVHKVLHNSFLALQVRLGQVVACGASLYKTEPNWLLLMNLSLDHQPASSSGRSYIYFNRLSNILQRLVALSDG